MNWIRFFSVFLLSFSCWSQYPAWKPIGPWGGAARVIRLDAAKPETLMAVAMRGTAVFRSRDGAKSWTQLAAFPELPNTRLDCGLISGGQWFVGAAPGGLYRSLDEGETWRVVAGTEKLSVYAITAWPKDARVMAAGTNQGVWMSNDAGNTWRRISPKTIDDLSAIVSVAFDPTKAGTIYAGTPHLPWKTINAGATWQKVHVGMFDDSDIFSIAVDPTRQGRVFASACSGIYCSLNAGGAWRRVQGIPGTNRRTYVVTQSPHDPQLLFAGTSAGMWSSRDGGMVWKKLNDFVATSIAFHPTNTKLFYVSTERHGLLRTLNGGASFEATQLGFASRSVESAAVTAQGLAVYSQYDGSFLQDSGEGWKSVQYVAKQRGGDWFELAINPLDPQVQLKATQNGLSKSNDGGQSWREVQREWMQSVAWHPKQKDLCFALRKQRVFWSPDAGENWYWFPAKEETNQSFEKLVVGEDQLFGVSQNRGVYVQELPKSVRMK